MGVDRELLADYVGGALEGTPEQERVARLIASSPEWGHAAEELSAALHDVQHDLNVLRGTPEPMPDDIVARFEGLFDGPRRDPLEPRVVTRRSARPAKRWKRWAAPIAITAAALGLFAIGNLPSLVAPAVRDAVGDSNSSRLTAEAPGAAPPAAVPTLATWRMYDRGNVAQGLAIAEPYGSRSTSDDRQGANEKADSAFPPPLQRLTDAGALQQCLNAVNSVRPGRVELVEYAYFEGSPALVITITSTNGQWRFVAGGNCGPLGADEKFQTPLK